MKLITIKDGKLKKAKRISLVVSALVQDKEKVLLVKRIKDRSFAGCWGLPNGRVKPGETLKEAVKREVKEETNLNVRVLEPYLLTQEFHDDHHHIVIAFKARIFSGILKAGSDAKDAKWFSEDEVFKLKLQPTAKEQLKTGLQEF